MTTGPANSRTYKKTIAAGAIAWGCFSINARRHLGGFPVGCYSVKAHASRNSIHPRLAPFSYFAMCNHGNKSPGCSTRSQSIKLAKLSQNYCDECKALFTAMPTDQQEGRTHDPKGVALHLIREGNTSAAVAKLVGVSPSTVSNWRRDAGLPGKKGGRAKNKPLHSTKRHDSAIKEQALQMFSDGTKIMEIERRLKIPYATIYSWTIKSGLKEPWKQRASPPKKSEEPPNLQVQEAHDNPLPITKPGKKSRVFGEIQGVPEGSAFPDRMSLSKSGVHRPPQAGISGSKNEGADSIVVSGGYVDDKDLGHTIYYTGQGGNDPKTGRQVADQELTRGNLALSLSCDLNLPVRVVRGWKGDPEFSPSSGYRYDGLFHVVGYGPETGSDGHRVWRFKLERAEPKPISKIIGDWSVQGSKMVFRVVRENEAPHVITAWNRDSGKNFEVSKTKVIDSPNGLLVEFQTTWPETGWCTNWHFQSFKTTKAGLQILGDFVTSKSRKSTQAHKINIPPHLKIEKISPSRSGQRVRPISKDSPPIGKEEPKPPSHNAHAPEIKGEALQMIHEGSTLKEVEAKLGIPYATIYAWVRKSDQTTHSQSKSSNTTENHPLRNEAIQMIRDGVSGAEVARRLGVHKGTVRKWRKVAGLSGTTVSPKHSLLKEEGLQMIRDGVSGAEVARRLGIHRSTVSKWRKSAGLSGVDGRKFHDADKENDVIDLLREGLTLNQISKSTGVGKNAILRIKSEAEREGYL